MDVKKLLGYLVALSPLVSFSLIWLYYSVLSPLPDPPPNLTLRGSEIVVPVLLGAILFIGWTVRGLLAKDSERGLYFVWAALAVVPPVIFWVL